MQRTELAAYLRAMADEFDRDSNEIAVQVGNKSVSLRPPETVGVDVEVVERSMMLRGDHESVKIELEWKP